LKKGRNLRSRLGKDDIAHTNPFLKEKDFHTRFWWRVYEDYEIVDQEDGLPYIRASGRDGYATPRSVRVYDPLVDTPRLFLDFARIAERKNPEEALLQWIARYGLLGFARNDSQFVVDQSPEVVIPPRQYDDRGGPGETLDAVWYEVYTTNETLTLYEAALNRDTDNLEVLLFPPEGDSGWVEQRRRHVQEEMRQSGANWTDALISTALSQVWEYVNTLDVYAFPAVGAGISREQPLLTVDRFTLSWGVRNLLGAMYLQFYWLISSASELSRCKHCGRIISHAPPMLVGVNRIVRKPRKDKEFCDSRCRQNYHYHHRIKPSRQSEIR
jgi:hypothetical protein